MSSASSKVLKAIHMAPESYDGGAISKIGDGDLFRLDANEGRRAFLGAEREHSLHTSTTQVLRSKRLDMGCELFGRFARTGQRCRRQNKRVRPASDYGGARRSIEIPVPQGGV